MSRQELADAANAYLAGHDHERWRAEASLDALQIGKLERGEHRWPNDIRRDAFRHVLNAETDAELGFYIIRGSHSEPIREAGGRQSTRQPDLPIAPGAEPQSRAGAARQAALASAEPDAVVLSVRIVGTEVELPLSRRLLLQAGIGSVVEAFALSQQPDMLDGFAQPAGGPTRLTITSPAHLGDVLAHLNEQWHVLVKTDNLLGPRFALAGVLHLITVIEALGQAVRDEQRLEAVRLAAKYAESAAWLYEDSGNMPQARYWTSRAMEWAYEGDDRRMVAWAIFRRAEQAAAKSDTAQAIGFAQAARRHEEELATPTRAAIRVQEAHGHALDGNEATAQRLLDDAHTWAASDTVGDAREGHGSYCTPSYIEIQRASCWLTTGKPKKAITLYEESLRTLPAVYQRNRAATLSRLAVAYLADRQPEQAAHNAHAALPIAQAAGSTRILTDIQDLGIHLAFHRGLPAVDALLDDLDAKRR
jgi:tetratricopeptide (TPR) repeat protein